MRRCPEGEMVQRLKICFLTTKQNTASLGKADKMGRGNHNGHTLFTRPELVPRNNETGNRSTKEVPAIRVASVEYGIKGTNPQSHDGYQADYLEAVITICARNGIAKGTAMKITDMYTKDKRGNN